MQAFHIFEATLEQLDAYIDLLEDAAAWLWARGVRQWRPGEHRATRHQLRYQLDHGCLILAEGEGRLAGGCLLTEMAPDCWPDASVNALYLSGLVVARWAAGRDLGGEILNEAGDATRRREKTYLRLDCWDGNSFLKDYYRAHGFNDRGRVREEDYWVWLFQRRVTPT